MNHFVTGIHITNLYHLEGIDISIADEKYPHLIITGKNGSGKTVLLNTIADALQIAKNKGDKVGTFTRVELVSLTSSWIQILNRHGNVTCDLDGYPKF